MRRSGASAGKTLETYLKSGIASDVVKMNGKLEQSGRVDWKVVLVVESVKRGVVLE